MDTVIPPNSFFDAETESFVCASQYTDANGNLVAPPGYSFVTAEVAAAPTPTPQQFYLPQYQQYYSPQAPQQAFYQTPSSRPYQQRPRRNNASARHNAMTKEEIITTVFTAVKERMTVQKKYVDIREEDEGYLTIRMHLKRIPDLVTVPMILQDIVCRGWVEQVSMHYIKKNSRVTQGISFYFRLIGDKEVLETIKLFAHAKIHCKRVATPPEGTVVNSKSSKTRFRDTPDEDPVLPEDSDDECAPTKKNSKPVNISQPKIKKTSRSKSFEGLKRKKSKSKSRSIPILIPIQKKKKKTSLVLIPKQPTMELTFEDGRKQVVKVNNTKRAKSIPISLVGVMSKDGAKQKYTLKPTPRG